MRQIQRLADEAGLQLHVKEGGSHTEVWFGARRAVVPRHTEINEITVRKILEQLGKDKR